MEQIGADETLVSRLRVLPEIDHVEVNTSRELTAKVYPEQAANKGLIWSVEPPHMGTISPIAPDSMPSDGWKATFTAGNLTGKVTITATATDGSDKTVASEITVVGTITKYGGGVSDFIHAQLLDIDNEYGIQNVVIRTPGQYVGHPSMTARENGDLLLVYPANHGKGAISLLTSADKGHTWSKVENTPHSWKDSMETPIVHRLNLIDGTVKFLETSGLPYTSGFNWSLSDDGLVWTEFQTFETGHRTIVALADLIQLKDTITGEFIDEWMGVYHTEAGRNFLVSITFSGGKGAQNVVFTHRELFTSSSNATVEEDNQLCEIGFIRSPDHRSIALLARNQAHNRNGSYIAFSYDEGVTWSELVQTPAELDGERHQGKYLSDGRLIISFREMLLRTGSDYTGNWVCGEWAAWVGTYLDLLKGGSGQYLMCIKRDYTPNDFSGDTAYSSLVAQSDGSTIIVAYGTFDSPGNVDDMKAAFGSNIGYGATDWTKSAANTANENGNWCNNWSPYIMSVTLTPAIIDDFAQSNTVAFDESWRKFPKGQSHAKNPHSDSEQCPGNNTCTYHIGGHEGRAHGLITVND